MKPTDLFQDLNDFQNYTDGLTPDTTYAQLSPSITTVVNTMVLPIVTASVYVALASAQPAEEPAEPAEPEEPVAEPAAEPAAAAEEPTQDPAPAPEVLLEGQELLKTAVAAGAMLQYQIFASVKKNGSDAALYKYQHEEMKDHYREAFWGAMDSLLDFLDQNTGIGDYKDSPEYKARQELPVKNAREFDYYYGIGASSFFYHKVLFLLRQVWRSDVKPLLPAEPTEKMQELAKEALCYKVVAMAVMQFDVTELPRSIRWDYNHEYTKGSQPQARNSLYAQLTAHFQSVAATLDRLRTSGNVSGSVSMNNNAQDHKYYGTL